MLTQEDFDPPLGNDSPRPDDRRLRIMFSCWPDLEDRKWIAVELVEAFEALDIDVEDVASHARSDGFGLDKYPVPNDHPEYHAPFDADYTYQYEYAEDIATIELAAHTDTVWAKPKVRWRVNAGAGTVAGDNGHLREPDRFSVPTINIGEHVHHGDDREEPIIACNRFSNLPVPQEVANDLRENLEQLRSVTPAGDNLETDPAAFPEKISSPDEYLPALKAVGWDSTHNLMWYGESDEGAAIPHAYQIEHGNLIHRNTHAQDFIEGDEVTWQALTDECNLEPVSNT